MESKTNYIILQKRTDGEQERIQAIAYRGYDNGLYAIDDTSQAHKFDNLDTAKKIKGIQEQVAETFDTPFTYSIIKEEVNRSEVAE